MTSFIASFFSPIISSLLTIVFATIAGLVIEFLFPNFKKWSRLIVFLIVISNVLRPAFEHFIFIQHVTQSLSTLFIAVYPIVTASILAAGGTFNLLNFQPAMLLFANGALFFADRLLIPLLTTSMILDILTRLLPDISFKKLSDFIRTTLLGVVSAIVACYSIFITAGGTMSWALSGSMSEPIKELISQNIPIIGSFMTESISSIGRYSSGTSVLISGWLMTMIWTVAIVPTLKTLGTALFYRWTAAFIEPFANKDITSLIDDIGKILLVLCALSFLIAFAFVYTSIFVMVLVKLLSSMK